MKKLLNPYFEPKNKSKKEKPLCIFSLEIPDWSIVNYDNELFPGEILQKSDSNQVQVSCMVKAGKYWKWPKKT